jgi:hypothetical protein
MQIADFEPFKNVPFYMWVKDANGVYLWGSSEMERFAGGLVEGRTVPILARMPSLRKRPPNCKPMIIKCSTAVIRFTPMRKSRVPQMSVFASGPEEIDGNPVTIGISFLVPGD